MKKEGKDSRRDQRYPPLKPDPFHLLPCRARDTFLERGEPSFPPARPLGSHSFPPPDFLTPLTDVYGESQVALVSQIHRNGWGLVALGFLSLILEKKMCHKVGMKVEKSVSLWFRKCQHLACLCLFVQPSDVCILLRQVIIGYILCFPQYVTSLGKIWKVTEAVKCC